MHLILHNIMKKTATIILNRNLPKPTDDLVESLIEFDGNYTDVFVLEAGSDRDKLSKYCTWHVETENAVKNGLRYSRGMNYGLLKLWNSEKWDQYDSFFLITNDTKFYKNQNTVATLQELLILHPKVGIVSPCSKRWREKDLIGVESTKYFWFIHNNAYFLRKAFVEQLINKENPTYMDFLFDGDNFRGYLSESEIIAKAYLNNWAAAITRDIIISENESYLIKRSNLIKTEPYDLNMRLYIKEGLRWMKEKYGFKSKWSMQMYVKTFYDKFFEINPTLKKYKI